MALARALADDPDVVVFGEDVGSTAAVAGLQQRFGAERVFDTPLSEALISDLAWVRQRKGLSRSAKFSS
jgi:pyruvate dehydrogenase E1 component beta subunit